MDSLVSTEWLADELAAGGDLAILDASYHLADTGRDAAAEYEAGHIPGAAFLDLADLADPAAPVENTMPGAECFASRMQSLGLGLGEGRRVVLYDDSAIKSATRAWYMLRLFGVRDVAILDGGFAKWKAEGRPVVAGREMLGDRTFTVRPGAGQLRSKAQILANLNSGGEQIVDARGPGRFTGEDKETRPGIASGHIPASRNVPYARLYNADGTFKDGAEIRAAFEAAGVDLARPIVTSCGSGMTACALAFALHRIGRDDVALYDGSWTEWGSRPETAKALGPG